MTEFAVGREPIHRTRYEASETKSLCNVVVDALATVAGTSPGDLEPLYETVDPEPVARLLDSGVARLRVEFGVADWTVRIRGDGEVLVYESDDET